MLHSIRPRGRQLLLHVSAAGICRLKLGDSRRRAVMRRHRRCGRLPPQALMAMPIILDRSARPADVYHFGIGQVIVAVMTRLFCRHDFAQYFILASMARALFAVRTFRARRDAARRERFRRRSLMLYLILAMIIAQTSAYRRVDYLHADAGSRRGAGHFTASRLLAAFNAMRTTRGRARRTMSRI